MGAVLEKVHTQTRTIRSPWEAPNGIGALIGGD